MSIAGLNQTVARLNNPILIDYANRVASVLNTAILLAEAGNLEELELLVIAVQDFAGQRGQVLQQRRLTAEDQASEAIHKAKG